MIILLQVKVAPVFTPSSTSSHLNEYANVCKQVLKSFSDFV